MSEVRLFSSLDFFRFLEESGEVEYSLTFLVNLAIRLAYMPQFSDTNLARFVYHMEYSDATYILRRAREVLFKACATYEKGEEDVPNTEFTVKYYVHRCLNKYIARVDISAPWEEVEYIAVKKTHQEALLTALKKYEEYKKAAIAYTRKYLQFNF